jgi:hypothetical protein
VTELLEGETLRERLDAGIVPVRKAVDFAVQVVHGLEAAHERAWSTATSSPRTCSSRRTVA